MLLSKTHVDTRMHRTRQGLHVFERLALYQQIDILPSEVWESQQLIYKDDISWLTKPPSNHNVDTYRASALC